MPGQNGHDEKLTAEELELMAANTASGTSVASLGETPNGFASVFNEEENNYWSLKQAFITAPKTFREAMARARLTPEQAKEFTIILAREQSTHTGFVDTYSLLFDYMTMSAAIYGLQRHEAVMAHTGVMTTQEKWWEKGARKLGIGRSKQDRNFTPAVSGDAEKGR